MDPAWRKGDRPTHIKFMTFPQVVEKPDKKALSRSREKKEWRRGNVKEALPCLHGVAGRQSDSRLQRAGWHLNGLVFDWPSGLKIGELRLSDRMDY